VSRVRLSLDEHIQAFRTHRFDIEVTYLFRNATYLKNRQNHHINSHAVFVAIGIETEGKRRIRNDMQLVGEGHIPWEGFRADWVIGGCTGCSWSRAVRNAV